MAIMVSIIMATMATMATTAIMVIILLLIAIILSKQRHSLAVGFLDIIGTRQ